MTEKQKLTRAELNQLAAEKVMGWQLSPTGKTWRIPDTTGLYVSGWNHQDRVGNWKPASDPAASKRLRDKMRADGWDWRAEFSDEECGFTFKPKSDSFFYGYVIGATEDLSCLLAALRAVGAISGEVEVEE